MAAQLADDVRDQVGYTVEHFNGNHADTVLFLARFAADAKDAIDAEVIDVDTEGVNFTVGDGTRTWDARLRFDGAVSTAAEVQGQLLGKLNDARADVGDREPVTSLERELATTGSLPTHVCEVVAVEQLTPNLVEITLGGLDEFTSLGADQFFLVMVPKEGEPPLSADYSMADYRAAEPEDQPHAAYYTVRRFDAPAGRLTFWAVLHGHEAGVGEWAGRCEVGERIAIWGPREGMGLDHAADRYLLVADESGLPAVVVLLEEIPAGVPVHVVIEVRDGEDTMVLPRRGDAEVSWVHRGEAAPGTGTALLDEVRSLFEGGSVSTDGLVVFGAGESRQMTGVRKYVRNEQKLPAPSVHCTGYWRR